MRCSQFAKHFAARTDAGTSDGLKTILPQVRLGCVAQNALDSVEPERRPRLRVCVFAIDSLGIHVNVGSRLGPDFCEGRNFLVTADRQSDRQTDKLAIS